MLTPESIGPVEIVTNEYDEIELIFNTDDPQYLQYLDIEVIAKLPSGEKGCDIQTVPVESGSLPLGGRRRLEAMYDDAVFYG